MLAIFGALFKLYNIINIHRKIKDEVNVHQSRQTYIKELLTKEKAILVLSF
ncbi:MAG: hypothetical protein ACOCRK_07305 [bacterium]